MCGRSSLTKTEKEIEKRFHATFYSEELERYNPLPNYNVAPGSFHPVITNQDPEYIHLYKWRVGISLIFYNERGYETSQSKTFQ